MRLIANCNRGKIFEKLHFLIKFHHMFLNQLTFDFIMRFLIFAKFSKRFLIFAKFYHTFLNFCPILSYVSYREFLIKKTECSGGEGSGMGVGTSGHVLGEV